MGTAGERVYIFVPAGARVALGDPEARPEYISRQAWGNTRRARECQEIGIGFGMELKAPERLPDTFNPEVLNGLPYAVHANPDTLTRLYGAEEVDDYRFIDEFWDRVVTWAEWDPKPLYVVFHGGHLEPLPSLDQKRFQCTVDPAEWLAFADWHITRLSEMQKMGLPVALENIYIHEYGRTERDWLPVTHFYPTVGLFQDMVNITNAAGVRALVDFHHLHGTLDALNGESLEIKELDRRVFAAKGVSPEFESFFGFTAEKGKICRAPQPLAWQGLVTQLRTPYYHIAGITPQVVQAEDYLTEYHRAITEQLEGNPYAQALVSSRRGASHGPIAKDDVRLREMVRHVLGMGLREPVTFLVEVAGPRDGNYWYWVRPDSLEFSLENFQRILIEEMTSR